LKNLIIKFSANAKRSQCNTTFYSSNLLPFHGMAINYQGSFLTLANGGKLKKGSLPQNFNPRKCGCA
jgi:hypothetical protein